MSHDEFQDKSRDFSLAVGKLIVESGLDQQQVALSFGVIVKAMATTSTDPRAAFEDLVGWFMHGMGAVALDADEARELMGQAEDPPPRVVN